MSSTPPGPPESEGWHAAQQPGGLPGPHDAGGWGGSPAGSAPADPISGGSHRAAKIAGLATVLTLIAGGGAFAVYKTDPFHLFTSGPQAAQALPANAIFYLGVDMDPSAEQKVKAIQFLNHFPAFSDQAHVDADTDLRERLISEALASSECDLSYDSDISPWLGNKFGVALLPGTDGDTPTPVAALEVTDDAAARRGLDKLGSCADASSGETGYAFVGDYVVMAETQDVADAAASSTKDAALADDGNFKNDMDALGDLGVATLWSDVAATADAYGGRIPAAAPGLESGIDLAKSTYQRAAATFRFESDHAEMVASVFGDTADIDHGTNQVVGLPSSTVFAMSESGGGKRLAASWDDIMAAASADGDMQEQLSDFEAQTGFTLPDDLETLLGDNLLLSVDGDGLTSDAVQQQDLAQVGVGVRFTSDPDDLQALYERLTATLDQNTEVNPPFAKKDTDDGMVVASNDDYAAELAALDGGLGGSDAFQSVTDDASSKEFVAYFDWNAVEDEILQAAEDGSASSEVVANLRPLRAFGLTVETDGDYTTTVMRLSVDDQGWAGRSRRGVSSATRPCAPCWSPVAKEPLRSHAARPA
ncbi:MAG: DUF3352 domain-containing protein [Nocardioidaceae bacterium]